MLDVSRPFRKFRVLRALIFNNIFQAIREFSSSFQCILNLKVITEINIVVISLGY